MTYDQAQSPRLGQRTPVESTSVRMFSGGEVPEAAWPGQLIYINEEQILQIYNGSAWEDVTGGDLGQLTFVGGSVPTAQSAGDVWFNTSDNNRMYVARSAGANEIAIGEWEVVSGAAPPITPTTYIYRQDTPPTAASTPPPKDNDFWYETPNNKQYYYQATSPGNHWVFVQDTGIPTAQATADTKTKNYVQNTPIPTSVTIGDTWVHTGDQNKLYVAKMVGANEIKTGEWELSQDWVTANALAASKTGASVCNNPSRTGNLTGWAPPTSGGVQVVENQDFNGITIKAAKLTSSTDSQFYTDQFDIEVTQAYEVRMWVKDPVDQPGSYQFYIGLSGYDAAGSATAWDPVPRTTGVIGTPTSNFYFGYVQTAQTGWTEWVAYILPLNTAGSEGVGLGTSQMLNAARPSAQTVKARVRMLNWANAGVSRDLWVAHVTVTPTSMEAIRINKARSDAKITTFYKAAPPPTSISVGDIWFDTAAGNKQYRATIVGATTITTSPTDGWWLVQDTAITAAATAANTANTTANSALTAAQLAQASADGSIRTYYSETPPWDNLLTDPLMQTSGWTGVTYAGGNATITTNTPYSLNVTAPALSKTGIRLELYNPTGAAITAYVQSRATIGGVFAGAHVGTPSASLPIAPSATVTWWATDTLQGTENGFRAVVGGTSVGLQIKKATGVIGDPSYVTDAVLGDMWFKTSTSIAYRWDGVAWVIIPDTAVSEAMKKATNAQTTADGKITAWYSTGKPWADGLTTHDLDFGDIWYDTDDKNKPYYWAGSRAWLSIQDGTIADANALAASKTKSFYQDTAPTATAVGDMWYETDDDNHPWFWDGAVWKDAKDPNIDLINPLNAEVEANRGTIEDLSISIESNAAGVTDAKNTAETADGRVSMSDYEPGKDDVPGRNPGSVWFTRTRARVNLCTNPSFEVNTTDWTVGGVTTWPRTLDSTALDGSYLVRVTNSGTVGEHYLSAYFGAGSLRQPCVEGQTYTASTYMRHVSGVGEGGFIRILWYNAAAANFTSTFGATVPLAPAAGEPIQWVRPFATGTAPAGAVSFFVRAQTVTTAVNDVWDMDAMLIEQDEDLGRYFDGDSFDGSWDDPTKPNNTTSSLEGNKILRVYELEDQDWQRKYFTEDAIAGLATTKLTGSLDGLILADNSIAPDKVITAQVLCSEALQAGNLVHVWNNGGNFRVRKADSANGYEAHGFVLDSASVGSFVNVFHQGYNPFLLNLLPGTQFLGTSGGVTGQPPWAVGQIAQRVGFAPTSSVLNFSPTLPIRIF